jgi:hypothetical protein
MRPLIIDYEAKVEITRVLSYARGHVIKVVDWVNLPVGDNPEYVCHIFKGFRVVYSIEDQPHYGLCHHLSISVDSEDRLPNIPAVEMIMKEFGLLGTINDCLTIWIEEKGNMAVNMLQLIARVENNGGSV